MVLQISHRVGTEVSEARDLRSDATWDWENHAGVVSAAGVELVEGHALPDHVHVLLGIPPKLSVAHTVGRRRRPGRSAQIDEANAVNLTATVPMPTY